MTVLGISWVVLLSVYITTVLMHITLCAFELRNSLGWYESCRQKDVKNAARKQCKAAVKRMKWCLVSPLLTLALPVMLFRMAKKYKELCK
jgi:hypothetical protein